MSSSRRRLLLVSFYFPPRPGVASMRLGNLIRHLPAHGWDVDVVAGPVGEQRDETLAEGIAPDRILRIAPLRRGPRVQGVRWALAALRPCRQRAREADVVLVSGGPFAPFLLGPRLGLPYVLDFRDPWSWEPRFGRLDPGARRRVGLALERRGEAAAVKHAAAIVTVAPEITDAYRRLYPSLEARVETLRHGWEPADFEEPVTPAAAPELVYAGTFLPGERTPGLLIEAARIVRSRAVPLRVRLLGSMPPELRAETASAEAEGWLEVAGMVSHREAVVASRRASVLWVQPGTLPFLITGKVYECLAAGPPIVAVAPPDGALAALLAQTGGAVIAGETPLACADALCEVLAEAPARNEEAIAALAAPRLAGQLAAILDEAVR